MLEEVEIPVSTEKDPVKEATKMETDEVENDVAPADTGESEINMQDPRGADDASGAKGKNGVAEPENRPAQMETEAKVCESCIHLLQSIPRL